MTTITNQPSIFARHALVRAIELELGIQADGRLASSTQGMQLMANSILSNINKSGNTGTGLITSLAINNPGIALAAGAIGLLAAAKASTQYSDYGSHPEDMLHAFRITMYANPDQITTINLSVTGGLTRFVSERIITQFQIRLNSLTEVLKIEPGQHSSIQKRILIYKSGMAEALKLQEQLTQQLEILTKKQEAIKNAARIELEQKKQNIQRSFEKLELSYKAGLLAHDQYNEKKMELHIENAGNKFTGFIGKIESHVKDTSLLGGENVSYFADLFFGSIIEESNKNIENKWSLKKYLVVGIFVIFCIYLFIPIK